MRFCTADVQVRNEVDISVDLYTAKAGATVLLRIAEDAFLKFPLKDTTNIFCWLATILPIVSPRRLSAGEKTARWRQLWTPDVRIATLPATPLDTPTPASP